MAEHRLNNAAYREALERGSRPPGLSVEDVLDALLEAEFLVPIEDGPDGGPPSGQISPRLFQAQGELALMAFTDRETARTLLPDDSVYTIALPGKALCRLAAAMIDAGAPLGGLIVDPSGPLPFALPRAQILEVAAGPRETPAPALERQAAMSHLPATDIAYVGLPTPPWGEPLSKPLLDALARAVDRPDVQEAYWVFLRQNDGTQDILLGLSPTDPSLMQDVWETLDSVWTQLGPEGCSFAVSALEGDWGRTMRDKGARLFPPT
ncbi:MAG: SseB family protein [Armatimonadota bacterium]|nr:SseB family protein [Armatimonadota bacterium]